MYPEAEFTSQGRIVDRNVVYTGFAVVEYANCDIARFEGRVVHIQGSTIGSACVYKVNSVCHCRTTQVLDSSLLYVESTIETYIERLNHSIPTHISTLVFVNNGTVLYGHSTTNVETYTVARFSCASYLGIIVRYEAEGLAIEVKSSGCALCKEDGVVCVEGYVLNEFELITTSYSCIPSLSESAVVLAVNQCNGNCGNITCGFPTLNSLYVKHDLLEVEVVGVDLCGEVVCFTHLELVAGNGRSLRYFVNALCAHKELYVEGDGVGLACSSGDGEALVCNLCALGVSQFLYLTELKSGGICVVGPSFSVVSLCEVDLCLCGSGHLHVGNLDRSSLGGEAVLEGEFNLREEVLELEFHSAVGLVEAFRGHHLFCIEKILGTILVGKFERTKTKFSSIIGSQNEVLYVHAVHRSQSCEVVRLVGNPVLGTIVTPNAVGLLNLGAIEDNAIVLHNEAPNIEAIESCGSGAGINSNTSRIVDECTFEANRVTLGQLGNLFVYTSNHCKSCECDN